MKQIWMNKSFLVFANIAKRAATIAIHQPFVRAEFEFILAILLCKNCKYRRSSSVMIKTPNLLA